MDLEEHAVDPISVAVIGIEFVLAAVFHAAVHVAGHEYYDALKTSRRRRLLRNHDVSRALNDSFLAAIALLEKKYRSGRPTRASRKLASEVFDRLRLASIEIFSLAFEDAKDDLTILPTVGESAVKLTHSVIELAQPAPADVIRLIEDDFAELYRSAFMEIGIKTNTPARTAIVHTILMDLAESSSRLERSLDGLLTLVAEPVATLAKQDEILKTLGDFEARADKTLTKMLQQLVQLGSEIQHLAEQDESGPILATLRISDSDGFPLLQRTIRCSKLTIGRDPENDIVFPNRLVSSKHATLQLSAGTISLTDHSTNGVFVNNRKVDHSTQFEFGDPVQIGGLVLTLHAPDSAVDHLPPTLTTNFN